MTDAHVVHVDRWLELQTGKATVQTQADTHIHTESFKVQLERKYLFLKVSLSSQHCIETDYNAAQTGFEAY